MNIHDDLYKKITPQINFLYEIWEPNEIVVVLGASQKISAETKIDNCERDGIQVLKRRGGGGAVVLMPGVLCITIAFLSDASESPYYFFNKINHFLINLLEKHFGIDGLSQRGSSDIAINDKKVLGCSIFKSRNLFHYQGSLLVNPALEIISRYLGHPTKEPNYRRGRSHDKFVTSFHHERCDISINQVKDVLTTEISHHLYSEIR